MTRHYSVPASAFYRPRSLMWPFRTADPEESFRNDLAGHFAGFLRAARARGKPQGLRWVATEPTGDVVFGTEKTSGRRVALAGVRVRFEPVEGEDMEEVAAAYEDRDATALFWFDGNAWGSDGRVLFNLGPGDAAERLADEIIST